MKSITEYINESLDPALKKMLRRLNLNAIQANEVPLDDDVITELSEEGYGLVSVEAKKVLDDYDVEIIKDGKHWAIIYMRGLDEDLLHTLEEKGWLEY